MRRPAHTLPFLCSVVAHEASWRCPQREYRGWIPVRFVLSAGADSLRTHQSAANSL